MRDTGAELLLCSLTYCLLTFPLPSWSWLRKVPTNSCGPFGILRIGILRIGILRINLCAEPFLKTKVECETISKTNLKGKDFLVYPFIG